MIKKISLLFTALLLTGCAQEMIIDKPAPQKIQVEKVDKDHQQGQARLYLCKDDKQVRVVHSIHKKRKKTLHHVTVTYDGVSEKLTLMISERGKNFANIRWTWQERDDFSILKSGLGAILAEQCVLKSSELLPSK